MSMKVDPWMIGNRRVYTLAKDLEHFLPFKIRSSFNSSNKITKVSTIPIIWIIAPPQIFTSPYATPYHVWIAYLMNYGFLHHMEY